MFFKCIVVLALSGSFWIQKQNYSWPFKKCSLASCTLKIFLFSSLKGKYNSTPPNTTQDPSGGPMLSHYPPLPPIHMPKLRQESRSGKSRYSDAGTFSEAGSPVAGRHEDISPSSPVIVHETPEQRRLSSPDILPVR